MPTRRPKSRRRARTDSAYGAWRSAIGSTRACSGASHSGKSPPVFSMRIPRKRSIDPVIARWIITGRSSWSSAFVKTRSNRSGNQKSSWQVPSCHERPITSVTWKSIFGP